VKTELANICMWCGNMDCAVNQLNEQGHNEDRMYPEVTACDDFADYRSQEVSQ